jgi:5-oxoprolinase (ATP-hydrolysing) subunit A
MPALLNLDGGEHDDEPLELYALADIVHVACGGHAGDESSMERVVQACVASGTRVGAHPSFVDREGFGRRDQSVASGVLERQIADQCNALRAITERLRTTIVSVKPHGALYHAAHRDPAIARAVVAGSARALGTIPIVGLAGGALAAEATQRGHVFLAEAFADRGVRADGSLVPRGEPGALVDDPEVAAKRALSLDRDTTIATLCVHADTPGALAIVRAVRAALGPKR